MRFSSEEYKRGLVKWDSDSEIQIRPRTSDGDRDSGWSASLTDPSGSIASSPTGRYTRIAVSDTSNSSLTATLIRWERLSSEGNIVTGVHSIGAAGETPIKLVNIPNYGTFHRVVIEAPATLQWGQDSVVRVGNILVRTHTGKLFGERPGSLETTGLDSEGNQIIESDWMGSEQRQGRFLEVVTDGTDHDDARLRSTAVIGLLALVLGNSVAGDVVFSEPYQAEIDSPQYGYFDIPNYSKQPAEILPDALEAIDRALVRFLSTSDLDRALQLALQWLERGLRSRTPLDEMICYFVGIEAILNAYVAEYGPIPELNVRRSHARELRGLLRKKLDKETREFLLNSLQRVTTRDRFNFYRTERNLCSSWKETFKTLSSARNEAFHGMPTSVTDKVSGDARNLLTRMLKTEFEIDLPLPWEQGPVVTGARLHYSLSGYGHQARYHAGEI